MRSPRRKGGRAVLIALSGGVRDEAGLPSDGTLPASWLTTSSMGVAAATLAGAIVDYATEHIH
jgi:hypothetical protein